MKTVLFLGYDKKSGLTYHFVDWISALDKTVNGKMKIHFLTNTREQFAGLFEKIKNLKSIRTVFADNFHDPETINLLKKANIIHCHGFRQVSWLLKIKKETNLSFKTVVTIHSFKHGHWYKHLYANLVSALYLNKIDTVHFLCHKSKNEFLRYNLFFKRNNRIAVYPLGCNREEFNNNSSIDQLNISDELSKKNKNIIYLATFSKSKQHLELIKILKDTLIRMDARLWLFGEGPERTMIHNYVEENNISDYIKLPGFIDRKYIPAILSKMDLAICFSKSETFGHCIAEPLFAGTPIVSLDVGIANYMVRDFTTGFLINDKSEQENFKKAVEYLLQNGDAAKTMGRNGKLFASQWMTWETISENTINMYSSLS